MIAPHDHPMRNPFMKLLRPSALALIASCLFGSAHAVDLIAIGQLSGTLHDLSGQSAELENGVAGDLLGGLGSGLAWAGGSTFLAVPDRGPNAVAWNAAIDDTASFIPRFHTLNLALAPATSGSLPYTLKPTLTRTTLLYSLGALNYGPKLPAANMPARWYFSGRSDNFDSTQPSSDASDARLDPEGIRVARNGKSVYISDEYGPYLYQFDRTTGARGRTIVLPANLAVAIKSPMGKLEISANAAGRVANKGMEGLAITPDGTLLVGFMQSPLIGDGGDGGRANRIVTVSLVNGETHQYVYDNYLADTAKAYNSSELLAINSHEFLVLERDGKGLGDDSKAVVKRLYKIDIAGAHDVSALAGEVNLLPYAVPKSLFLDVRAKLNAAGVTDANIPAKIEGAAFGADLTVGGVVKHTLYLGNDNDFLATSPAGLANPNQWFVFTFTDADLGGSIFVPQTVAAF
jgi:hypothetical protein